MYIFIFLYAFIIFFSSQYLISKRFLINNKKRIIYNILSILILYSFLYIFIDDIFLTSYITAIIFFVLSIAFYYIHEFRGNTLNFADIQCISTAKEVAGGYKYNIKIQFIISAICFFAPLIIFNYIDKYTLIETNEAFLNYRLLIRIICFFILYMLLFYICKNNYYNYSLNAGEEEGYIYNFFSSIPIFYKNNRLYDIDNTITLDGKLSAKSHIEIDKNNVINLDNNNTNDIKNSKTEDTFNKPHIIVIMNESFGHINDRIKTNIPVTPVYDNLKNVVKGNLIVNTFGGGTETTEFEFLTGMHIGSNPYPIYPYNSIKTEKYTLARFFNSYNYKTIAMHPYTATNYHRDRIYKLFGFDELIFYDDFKHKNVVRNYVSDEEMYKEVIDRYEYVKNQNEKCFIFGITMQNHSGYDIFDGQEIEVLDDFKNKISLNSYLSLLHISDKSINTLIDYFEKQQERVIICFFGDHNASFSSDINKKIYDMSSDIDNNNAFSTPFFIYDNKNKKDEYIDKISTNFLSLELIKRTGFNMTEYYNFLNSIYDKVYYMSFHKEKMRKDNAICFINENEKSYMSLKNYFLK